ncbi:DUF3793 family protein [Chakrabartyella piscis]|uniref:DUF3793 family protein n=1 Tax=Chakrabartyella piscis TaxID=2918914 RepID=UPI0029589F35|nr:DUF3793 family protein [Chakrabartyella piscis]
MSHQTVVRYCAPTLAGMKVGSLFSIKYQTKEELYADVAEKNKLLNEKGLYFTVLKICPNFALVYVYRLKQLVQVLAKKEIQSFLCSCGYKNFDLESVLKTITTHFEKTEFPHEIGVLLGYPLEDIKAFIADTENKACYVGCWKAYSNEDYARMIFEKYKKCTAVYEKKLQQGFDITRLTVAC